MGSKNMNGVKSVEQCPKCNGSIVLCKDAYDRFEHFLNVPSVRVAFGWVILLDKFGNLLLKKIHLLMDM